MCEICAYKFRSLRKSGRKLCAQWWFVMMNLFALHTQSAESLFPQLTQDAGDSLLAPIDQMFSPDPRPKTDHDRIYCHVLDFVNDSYVLNDLNCDVVLMPRPVLVLPLHKRYRIATNSCSKSFYRPSYCSFSVIFSRTKSEKKLKSD